MDDQILAIYVLVSELLKAMNHQENAQCTMSDAEVITTALVSTCFFHGNYELARSLLRSPQYIPTMLSKSRFNRRLHRIKPLCLTLFSWLGEHWKSLNAETVYLLDTFPVAVCDNWRIDRCQLYQGKAYRGYIASKRRYFYGLKLHLMVTQQGQPIEFFLTPGAESDVANLDLFDFDLPAGSTIFADKIYNHYVLEDVLEEAGLHFLPVRKKNSKRPLEPWLAAWQKKCRKMVETTGSLIERILPKHIHAVTSVGFELKVALFVLSNSLSFAFK